MTSSSLRCIDRQSIGRNDWNSFVDSSSEAWLWHRYETQDALQHWRGREDISFMIIDSADGIVCMVPLHVVSARRAPILTSIIDSLGGPAFRDGISVRVRRRTQEYLRDVLLTLSSKRACNEITLSIASLTPFVRGERCPRVNPLLELGCENTLSQTWVIDIRRGKAALWNSFEGRARTAIRKAEKLGVTVRLADQPDDLDRYYKLHCETYCRTGVTPHPKAYFEAIWRDFFSQGLARIWFAEVDGKVLAAENFGVFKGAAIYWTGAASTEGLEVGANPLLQWTAMQWMADAGVDWYETGEAFPNAPAGKARGLSDFKKSFGGELYPYYKGRINTEGKLFKIMKLVKGVVS